MNLKHRTLRPRTFRDADRNLMDGPSRRAPGGRRPVVMRTIAAVVCQSMVFSSLAWAPGGALAACGSASSSSSFHGSGGSDFGDLNWLGTGTAEDGDNGDGGDGGGGDGGGAGALAGASFDPCDFLLLINCGETSSESGDSQWGSNAFNSMNAFLRASRDVYESSPLAQGPRFDPANRPDGQALAVSIELADANRRVQVVDYAGAGSAALLWSRVYNSNVAVNTAQTRVSMGAGWRSTWDNSVQAVSAATTRLHRANGRAMDFTWNGSAWVGPSALGGTLTAVSGGWQYINTRDGIETYNSAGRLTSVGRGGMTTSLQYDANARLSAVVNPFGRSLAVGYDGASRVSTVTMPDGATLGYSYDASGRLASQRQPDNSVRQYLHEHATYPTLLTGASDESGRRISTWGYDSAARPSATAIGSNVAPVSVSYSGNVVTTTDARGTQRARALSAAGPRVVVTSDTVAATADSSALTVTAAYDGAGRPLSVTLPTGETISATYDLRGRPTSITRAVGTAQALTTSITWHAVWNKPTRVVQVGVTRDFTIDAVGRVTQVTETAAGTTRTIRSRVYNAQNLLQSSTDARGSTWSYSYDTLGNPASSTDPNGRVTQYQNYNVHGQAGRIVRADGVIVDRSFDSRRRITAQTAAGRTTSYQYDSANRVTRRTEADGAWVAPQYNSAGLLSGVNNHRAESVVIARDVAGAVTSQHMYNASGALVRGGNRQLDALGRVKLTADARGYNTLSLYHPDGRPRGVTDPAGQSFTQALDLLNRVTTQTQPNTTAMRNAGGAATTAVTHAYDAAANHVSTTDNTGVGTTYTHDSFRQRSAEYSTDAGTQSVVRNLPGDVVSATDATSQTSPRTYDALGRVTTVLAGTPNAISYTYVTGRSDGLLAQMTDANASTTWAYDSAGRLLTKTQTTTGGTARTLTINRDSLGRPISMTYPSGMQLGISYTGDVVSALTVNGAVLMNGINYRPFSQTAASWQWGGGSNGYSRGFDTDGRITSVTLGPRTRSYTYDAAGRVATQATTGASTQAYSYDELGQLTGDGSNSYTWDANSNRRSSTVSGTTRPYTYTAGTNRLASVAGLRNYTHAADGAVASDGTGWTFQYDYLRRKVRAQKPMDITVTYLTNGLGQRVRKEINKYFPGGTPTAAPAPAPAPAATAGSETSLVGGPKVIAAPLAPTWRITSNRQFFYDDGGRLLGEYDSASAAGLQETIWFNGQPVAMQQGGVLYRVHADHLATPRSITRASDNVEVWRWDSDAFGNGTPITMGGGSTVTYHPRFPGQYLDAETGLHYNMARYYDPVTGRYTQADPIGLDAGVARYTYVSGDPLSFVDPAGLMGGSGAGAGRLTNDVGMFANAWWSNFKDTNAAVSGLAAPTGATLLTGRIAANSLGGVTFFDVALGILRGTQAIVAGNGTSLPIAGGAALTSAAKTGVLNAIAVNAAFEVGIALGSIPNALVNSRVPASSCPGP